MSDTISIEEWHKRNSKAPKPPKLKNVITEYNGRKYASKKEANKAMDLDWQKKEGFIADWKPQVKYRLEVNGVFICHYILDFLVTHLDGSLEYIDVKGRKAGVPYEFFKTKQRLMKAIHNIEVKEV